MNSSLARRLSFVLALLLTTGMYGHAETPASAAPAQNPASAASPAEASDKDDFSDDQQSSDRHDHFKWRHKHNWHEHSGNDVVGFGHDSTLPSGQKAESVVSILGSSTSVGEALDVVSILGNTRVTGPVGDTAVAVLGNTYVDSKVEGDVVAVLGDVELGPNAEVGGDVVAVFGVVKRDPAATVHGDTHNFLVGSIGGFEWLHSWIKHCLLYGRPLAFAPGLGWAWTLALGFLALYVCIALLFRSGIDRCVQTVNTQPGHTALAALLAMLLTPVLIALLCVTVIGIAVVPFVVAALFCASLFGKAVMLAWMGSRVAGNRSAGALHPALAVLIGGAITLVLYVIPVLGFLVYKLLGFFALGAVVYTLILAVRARKAANAEHVAPFTGNAAAAAPVPGPVYAASAPDVTAPPAAGPIPGPASSAGTAPAAPPSTPAPAHITAAMPRAGFWIRMAALLLDVLLVGFVLSVLHPFGHLHLILLAVYGAIMWKLRGSTVGGIVFDLHVVRLDGRAVDWETAIVRALGCFLSLAVVGLGFIWIAFDAGGQAWHDKIAGTVVVQAKRGVPLA
jgi:uncharacterized RDD family membrane protein YckC